MKKTNEDNTVEIIQLAIKYFGIRVLKNTVKNALKSHPDYPTFKSICDTLSEWHIENYPLKYEFEELSVIEFPYIVHFNKGVGQILFVTGIENDQFTCYTSLTEKIKISKKKFAESYSGAIILLNPDKNSGEKDFATKWKDELISRSILPLVLCSILVFVLCSTISHFTSFDKINLPLFITKCAGIMLSILLIMREFEIYLSLTEKLCHFNNATNCNIVLNDKSAKFFGWFGWADLGVIYFTGGLFFLIQELSIRDYSILALLSALSLPYPLFSIYYQGFVLKKWCPLCLGVQILLITEFVLLLPQFSKIHFSFSIVSGFILIYLITGIVYLLLTMYYREKMSNESNYFKYLGFKKNPDILRTLLFTQKYYNIPVTKSSLFFGEKDSLLKLTVFLSLHCSHCARAFAKINNNLRSESKISINIILISSDVNILNTVYYLKQINKDESVLDLLDQWFNADPYSRGKISETFCIPDVNDISDDVSNENLSLFKACDLVGTPSIFINGYLLPIQYDLDDIKYFSEVFKRNELITK